MTKRNIKKGKKKEQNRYSHDRKCFCALSTFLSMTQCQIKKYLGIKFRGEFCRFSKYFQKKIKTNCGSFEFGKRQKKGRKMNGEKNVLLLHNENENTIE